jgi:hypothetical protein
MVFAVLSILVIVPWVAATTCSVAKLDTPTEHTRSAVAMNLFGILRPFVG